MKNIFYLNGKFLEENKAKISVYDLGINRGYGVFDFLRTYNRKPFYLEAHLKRLLNSAKIIGLKHNFTLISFKKIVLKMLDKNKHLKEANIRIILTGGFAKDFLTPSKPNLIILITPIKKLPDFLYQKGAKLITKIFERPLPQAKTIIYTESIKFLQEAKKKKAIEVLFINKEGKILECATSNFFAVIDEKIYTPPIEKILPGVTRELIIHLSKKLKISVFKKDIYFEDIKRFNECFITATNKEILPVRKIDNVKIKDKIPGKITKILIDEFQKLVENYK